MLSSDVHLFLMSFMLSVVLMFVVVKSFKALCKLEEGEISAVDCCSRLNFWNVPKFWLQFLLIALFVSRFQWTFAVLNSFLLLFIIRKVFPPSSGDFDPKELKNVKKFHYHMNVLWVQFLWHLMGFFVYAYYLQEAVMIEVESTDRQAIPNKDEL